MSEAPQWVYFLRPVGEEGPVKIGVSEVPENRLRTYMVWSPMILEVAAKIEVALPVLHAVVGHGVDDFIEKAQERHAENARRLGSLVGGYRSLGGPRAVDTDRVDQRAGERRQFARRRVGSGQD